MAYYCAHCGSDKTHELKRDVPDNWDMYVAEDTGCSTEYFDDIIAIKCDECGKNTYPSTT